MLTLFVTSRDFLPIIAKFGCEKKGATVVIGCQILFALFSCRKFGLVQYMVTLLGMVQKRRWMDVIGAW